METTYVYQKKRAEFGRQCLFNDKGPELIDNYQSNKKLYRDFILKDPFDRSSLCAPIQAEHWLNTMRAEYANSSMNHIEGGWPKDVNKDDEEQTKRYRRKVEKDEAFYTTMMHLFKNMDDCILQNNAINIYQQYFSDVEQMPFVERSSARTVNVYRDPSEPPRPVNRISWSPDGQTKLAITHCNLKYQSVVPKESKASYIWEIENPNLPLQTLHANSSIVCLEYNPRDAHALCGGLLNGEVAIWDVRKGNEPVEVSPLENSFRDPVHNALWINSKTGTDFFSASTDGYVKWWDARNLSEPTEVLMLDYAKDEEQSLANAYGASALEYEPTIPTRFMIGTEQGIVISCNRKNKSAMEKMQIRFTAHPGPVLKVQRSPGFVKSFLTIGDWSSKIWAEDCKESFILWTGYHKVMLTDGAWSPTRLSVFFTTRSDGVLDVWDILQQQDAAALGIKVSADPLTCLRSHEMGRIVAVGNSVGTTYLVQLSENLTESNKNDKALLTAMLDRENHREKILEARNREIRLKLKAQQVVVDETQEEEGAPGGPVTEEAAPTEEKEEFFDNMVRQAEIDFYDLLEKEKRVVEPVGEVNEEDEEGFEEPKEEEDEAKKVVSEVAVEEPKPGKKKKKGGKKGGKA